MGEHRGKDNPMSDYTSRRSPSVGYRGAKDRMELREDKRVLENLLLEDPLTNLPNERRIRQESEKLFHLFKKRSGEPFGVVFMDLDNFKKAANDAYGHHVGDLVLQEFAAIINPNIHKSDDPDSLLTSPFRDVDLVGRMHGDEHAALLPEWNPDTDLEIFSSILEERLNNKLKALVTINYPDRPGLGEVGVSLGVAVVEDGDYTYNDVFERADKVLYEVKSKKKSHRD